jgi:hypothetical protein
MAYNEERNTAHAIRAVLEQRVTSGETAEFVVLASGCTDRPTDIVGSLARDEPRLPLIVEEERAGLRLTQQVPLATGFLAFVSSPA